jgi:pyruvate dehydrogenase E2 component (dihydrolipoamide acetyltransferase)
MAYVIAIPKLGLSMTEGTISRWLKQEGDWVNKGDELVEIETEKISNVIEANEEGYLRLILLQEQETGAVQSVIGIIAAEDEDISQWAKGSTATEAFEAQEESEQESATNNSMKDVMEEADQGKSTVKITSPPGAQSQSLSTPAAKAFARQHQLELSQVRGTGPNGRIQERDVVQYYEQDYQPQSKVTPVAQAYLNESGQSPSELQQKERLYLEDISKTSSVTPETSVVEKGVLSGVRKVTAQRMEESWKTIPHVTLHRKITITQLMQFHQDYVSSSPLYKEHKVTLTHYLVKACSIALQKFKGLNASLEGQQIIYHPTVNMGVAVAAEQGLLVPVIKDTDTKGVFPITKELAGLVEAAKSKQIQVDQLTGGTFTISNLGMYEIEYFTPIINPPQAAILGVGSMREEDGQKQVYLSLSFDHRLADGAEAALFLKEIQSIVADPFRLMT